MNCACCEQDHELKVRTVAELDLQPQSLGRETVQLLFPEGEEPIPYKNKRPQDIDRRPGQNLWAKHSRRLLCIVYEPGYRCAAVK